MAIPPCATSATIWYGPNARRCPVSIVASPILGFQLWRAWSAQTRQFSHSRMAIAALCESGGFARSRSRDDDLL